MQHSAILLPFLMIGLLLSSSRIPHAQAPAAAPADVGTIADIMRVSYEVISGPAGCYPPVAARPHAIYARCPPRPSRERQAVELRFDFRSPEPA